MSRALTIAAQTESLKPQGARPVLLVELQFDSGVTRLWSGFGDLVWNGGTYSGAGALGSIGIAEETIEQKALGITLTLSGIPTSVISLALNEDVIGRIATVWLAFLDAANLMIGAPVTIFAGRMDTMDVALAETATVTVTAESRLIDWDHPRERRYTDADQQERFPGDQGLAFVSQSVEKEIIWGRSLG